MNASYDTLFNRGVGGGSQVGEYGSPVYTSDFYISVRVISYDTTKYLFTGWMINGTLYPELYDFTVATSWTDFDDPTWLAKNTAFVNTNVRYLDIGGNLFADVTIEAKFMSLDGDTEFSVTALSSDEQHGTVDEPTFVDSFDYWLLSATPNADFAFDHWEITSGDTSSVDWGSGSPTSNPANVTVSEDTTFTAIFVPAAIKLTGTYSLQSMGLLSINDPPFSVSKNQKSTAADGTPFYYYESTFGVGGVAGLIGGQQISPTAGTNAVLAVDWKATGPIILDSLLDSTTRTNKTPNTEYGKYVDIELYEGSDTSGNLIHSFEDVVLIFTSMNYDRQIRPLPSDPAAVSRFFLCFVMPDVSQLTFKMTFKNYNGDVISTETLVIDTPIDARISDLKAQYSGLEYLKWRFLINNTLDQAADAMSKTDDEGQKTSIFNAAKSKVESYIDGSNNDFIEVAFQITNVLPPTLIRVPDGVVQLQAMRGALEQEYPTNQFPNGNNPHGTWYIDGHGGAFGLFINDIGVDPDGLLRGNVDTHKAYVGNITYVVNGFFADKGVSSWLCSDKEVFLWNNKGNNPVAFTLPQIANTTSWGTAWAIAVMRDEGIALASIPSGKTLVELVEIFKGEYPGIVPRLGVNSLPEDFTSDAQVIAAKAAIDVLDNDSVEADVKAARMLYNTISTELYKFYFQNYEPYKTAYEKLIELEKKFFGDVDVVDYAVALNGTLNTLAGTTPGVGSVDGEWAAFALARGGRLTGSYKSAYLAALDTALASHANGTDSKTDLERIILALTALGIDASDYNDQNHVAAMDALSFGTVNGDIYALLALNSKPYDSDKRGAITTDYIEQGEGYVEKEIITGYIYSILDKQLDDYGWAISGIAGDVDTTAMAIQALAPYYQTSAMVNAAIRNALDWLRTQQQENGGFAGMSAGNSTESSAQVVVALTALGIDPTSWEKPGGRNPLTAMLENYNESGGWFGKGGNATRDNMSTELKQD
ncbi:MAG: terpene cyclase/mutase family protein [Oscillospiraceae bacterium]|nr:terpene cyclase/mutase family protein [Oscillospiraceae bacterium]